MRPNEIGGAFEDGTADKKTGHDGLRTTNAQNAMSVACLAMSRGTREAHS